MSTAKRGIRNLVVGLTLAFGLSSAVEVLYASGCDVTVNCPNGGWVYCWCNGSEGSCSSFDYGCSWSCGGASGNQYC